MLSLLAVLGHVPTYGSADQKCIQPPHVHTTSQAVYLKGSGGLEVHTLSDTDPFDTVKGEMIDVDAVFRKQYPKDWFDLYIGCGGCVAAEDPIVIPPFQLDPWDHGTIEPFTQTAYYSPILKARRKFNASLLNSAVCDQKHFTVRLVQNSNATEDIVWSAVIGLGETFTFVELLSFPVYVLTNHADWNDAGWTWLATLLVFAPLVITLVRSTLKACNVRVLEFITVKDWKIVVFFEDWRDLFYEIAIWGFTSAALEMFIHLALATQGISEPGGFFAGLIAVVLIPNGLGIALALNNWTALRFRKQLFVDKDWPDSKRCSRTWYKLSSNPWLAPLEIATGFSFFFLFGAGFFLGPAAIMITGCIRFTDLRYSKYVKFVTTGYARKEGSKEGYKEVPPAIVPYQVQESVADRPSLIPGIYIGR